MELARVIASLSIIVISAGCFSGRPWRRADDFAEDLKCDMSLNEVTDHLAQFRGLQLHGRNSGAGLHVARKGHAAIKLWFERDQLKSYQTTWIYFVTNIDSLPRVDLCTGAQTVILEFHTSGTLAGAVIWLDDVRVGELSERDYDAVDVPLGAHELRIEKAGSVIWSKSVHYDESSSGWVRVNLDTLSVDPTASAG